MAVTNESELIAARLAGDNFAIDKASNGNQTVNTWTSLWQSTGIPAAGATPAAAALCTKALTGAVAFNNPVTPAETYLTDIGLVTSLGGVTMEVWDRVAHMGGLSFNINTSQTVNLDLTSGGLNPPAGRVGLSDLTELEWWLETYADGGATASNATVNVTFTDASSANLNVIAVGGTLRARRLIRLRDFLPAGSESKVIQDVNTVILSAATGTAGSFGFTATRRMTKPLTMRAANLGESFDYQSTGMFQVPADACLMLAMLTNAPNSGTVRGIGKIARG